MSTQFYNSGITSFTGFEILIPCPTKPAWNTNLLPPKLYSGFWDYFLPVLANWVKGSMWGRRVVLRASMMHLGMYKEFSRVSTISLVPKSSYFYSLLFFLFIIYCYSRQCLGLTFGSVLRDHSMWLGSPSRVLGSLWPQTVNLYPRETIFLFFCFHLIPFIHNVPWI